MIFFTQKLILKLIFRQTDKKFNAEIPILILTLPTSLFV